MKARPPAFFSVDEFDFAQSEPRYRRALADRRSASAKRRSGARRDSAQRRKAAAAAKEPADTKADQRRSATAPTARSKTTRRGRNATSEIRLKNSAAAIAVSAATMPVVRSRATVSLEEPPPAPKQSYKDWLAENTKRSRWTTWFTAFYVHWLALLLLAVIVVHGPDRYGDFVFTASMSDPENFDSEPVELLETKIDVAETLEVEPVPVEMEMAVNDAALAPEEMSVDTVELDKGFLSSLAGHSSTTEAEPASSQASGDSLPLPVPVGAVTDGSFSVWTEPDNPDPGEPYKIVIQIQLPKGATDYNLNDLEGVVVGSDGYRKPIPGSQRGKLPVKSGCVRLIVHIVSADAQVQDTIFIRSRLLKEAAKMLIEF